MEGFGKYFLAKLRAYLGVVSTFSKIVCFCLDLFNALVRMLLDDSNEKKKVISKLKRLYKKDFLVVNEMMS